MNVTPFVFCIQWLLEVFEKLQSLAWSPSAVQRCCVERWLEMGPAVLLDKEPTGLGSLLTGLICSATEGYALEWKKRLLWNVEILANYSQNWTNIFISAKVSCVRWRASWLDIRFISNEWASNQWERTVVREPLEALINPWKGSSLILIQEWNVK